MIENHLVIAAVIIGRNKGQRLLNCLNSVRADLRQIIYVDLDSTDDSLANAAAAGVPSISLGGKLPCTSARARNMGAVYLSNLKSPPTYVQFIDADCELQPFWLGKARVFLDRHPDYAVVSACRQDSFHATSVSSRWFNLLWQPQSGESKTCGNNAFVRLSAFQQLSGYRAEMHTGHQYDLCLRLRKAGWRIYRTDTGMVTRDTVISRISQWFYRSRSLLGLQKSMKNR